MSETHRAGTYLLGGVRRLQTGLLRTYVFFIASGIAVVGIVFLLVR